MVPFKECSLDQNRKTERRLRKTPSPKRKKQDSLLEIQREGDGGPEGGKEAAQLGAKPKKSETQCS